MKGDTHHRGVRLRVGIAAFSIVVIVVIAVLAALAIYAVSIAYTGQPSGSAAILTEQYIGVINPQPPPYEEYSGVLLKYSGLVNETLRRNGIMNYEPIVSIVNGNLIYIVVRLSNSSMHYGGILIRGNYASMDELSSIPYNETTRVYVVGSGPSYLESIERYAIYNITGPLLEKYFPDAAFFGGFVNYTGEWKVGPIPYGSVTDYGEFYGETGEWVEMTEVNDYGSSFPFYVIKCGFADQYSPLNVQSPQVVFDNAAASFYSALTCPSDIEDWATIYLNWDVNTLGMPHYTPVVFSKGIGICGACPAA
ncbi:hypothetical protein GCM10007981_06820 [Thermocladium modestius]|uniref:Uncharacterized protein n=2 Tax=Thermocladium modestius TaxID=62609 RepID=A0A830GSD6_9CREN|nr:hypothetical protein GCM10007981_06820 [Thermocladium modestius]